jgi:hypothetical protein
MAHDPSFARALLDEAASLFLTGKPVKSLHRMLSAAGNPSMDSLAVIFGAIRHELGVGIRVKTIKAA